MLEGTIRILQRDTNLLKFTSFIFLYLHFEPLFRIYIRERPCLLVSVDTYTRVVNVASMVQVRGKFSAL